MVTWIIEVGCSAEGMPLQGTVLHIGEDGKPTTYMTAHIGPFTAWHEVVTGLMDALAVQGRLW